LYVNANEMAWILRAVEQKPPSAVMSGKSLYVTNCAACHKADLSRGPPEFPSLKGLKDKYSDTDVATLLYQGSGRMPSFAHLGRETITAIVNYVVNGEDENVRTKQDSPFFMKYLNDGYTKFLDPDGYPAVEPPWGTLNAINLNTGEYAWLSLSVNIPSWPQKSKEYRKRELRWSCCNGGRTLVYRCYKLRQEVSCVRQNDRQTALGDNIASWRKCHEGYL
jgi:cytochrome c5